MKNLRIAKDFTLPIEAITECFGIIAKRGVGKTYTASVLIEEMLKAGLPVCIIDPTGAWWGLRAAADGIAPGLPIAILGGEHGDLPLTEDMGLAMATLVIEQRVPVVIDLSLFHKAQMVRFMTAFAEKIYHSNREALHLVLDEADMFAPQNVFKGGEKLLGAIENIVRRGRLRGLGITLITQRPAVLNKNVFNMIEVLIALRTIAPQDRDAVDQWVKANATAEQRKDFMDSLASLPIGTAWFWSPGWLDVFQKVEVRQRETYDSSRTPKVGELKRNPKTLADIDVSALQAILADSLKTAAMTDPKLLQQRIRQLEQALAAKPKMEIDRIEVPVVSDDDLGRLEAVAQGAISKGEELLTFGREIMARIGIVQHPTPVRQIMPTPSKPIPSKPVSKALPPANNGFEDEQGRPLKINAGARKMLNVMAQRHPTMLTRNQVAMLSGFSPKSGTYSNYLADLRRAGFLVDDGGMMTINESGIAYLGNDLPEQPQGTAGLMGMWRGSLNAGAYRMLEVLVELHPDGLSRTQLAEQSNFSPSSGTYSNYLADLRRAGLLSEQGGRIFATDNLFIDVMERA